jgi:hypothetical protein
MQFIKDKWLLLLAALSVTVILVITVYHPYTGPAFIADPVQLAVPQSEQVILQGRNGPVTLKLLASYEITAAVKSKYTYSSDYPSQVSPLDLVLAWGNLNTRTIDSHIRYSQSGRWYYYNYDHNTPVDQTYIQEHSANTHLIPADNRIKSRLQSIRKNDIVELDGYLVQVLFAPGPWTSSLTRQDSGDGACEIMYVTKVSIQ